MPLGSKGGDAFLEGLWVSLGNGFDLNLHLYDNDPSETYDDTPAVYSELTVSGYAAVTLNGGFWTVTPDDPFTHADYAPVGFTFGGACSVYGYYITDPTDTYLVFRQRFTSAPFVYPSTGGPLIIVPQIGLQ